MAEKVLQGPELEALLRVLGADGARVSDAAFTRAAVDEMARACAASLCLRHRRIEHTQVQDRHRHKQLRPIFERVRKGSLNRRLGAGHRT